MYSIDAIQPDYTPRKLISEHLPEIPSKIKMYEPDSAFLCGLLNKFKPEKILEVGIANGGTTAVIIQCMHTLGIPFQIHCVDLLEKGYAGSDREIGYLGKEASRLLHFDNYHLWSGVCLPQVIDRIGGDIDFLILDTTHRLPGETLDFLAAYPYLSADAVVCMHDIRQNHNNPPDHMRIATNALFNSVAADKYIYSDATRQPDYPNMGAFKINADTEKYITNVFGVLTQNWAKLPSKEMLASYKAILCRSYSEESLWIFDHALQMNQISLKTLKKQFRISSKTKTIFSHIGRFLPQKD